MAAAISGESIPTISLNRNCDYLFVKINGVVFWIFYQAIERHIRSIVLGFPDYNLIILAPITALSIHITAHSVFAFADITALKGGVEIHASHRVTTFNSQIRGVEPNVVEGANGVNYHVIDPMRKNMIVEMFQKGLQGEMRFEHALVQIFAAADDATKRGAPQEMVNLYEAFAYLDIPTEPDVADWLRDSLAISNPEESGSEAV